MNPLPAQMPDPGSPAPPATPPALDPPPSYSMANRRAHGICTQRAYPWLLGASMAISATFCLMYISKPVIIAAGSPGDFEKSPANRGRPVAASGKSTASLLPDRHRLPGETIGSVNSAAPPPPPADVFERTNLRVQHILTAEAPGGHLAKIDIDVPVLYRSRELRWTVGDVADARALLDRLTAWRAKSGELRTEGDALLGEWNLLVARSIPAADLRADSPTLPSNQQESAPAPAGANLETASIQLPIPADQ